MTRRWSPLLLSSILFFLIGKQKNSIKKVSNVPNHTWSIKGHKNKGKIENKGKTREKKKHKRQKKPPILPHKPRALKETWATLHNSKGALAFNLARTNTPNIEIDRAF
jgi:hypothetical protein